MVDDVMVHARPVRPSFDPELASSLVAAPPRRVHFDEESLARTQREIEAFSTTVRGELEAAGFVIEDHVAAASDGFQVPLHHVRRPGARPGRPCVYYVHGGGMVIGTPWDALEFGRWIDDFDVSVVTVGYRLAPHVKAPTLVEDCYAGLVHVHDNAAQMGIDPSSIVVAGMSAGGGLAAGTALLARDREGPPVLGQLLMAPMLDPDADGHSVQQQPADGPWTCEENQAAWQLVLGGVDVDDVGHNAPGRAVWLGDLPPALLEVGSAEIFRSEVIEYSEAIWRAGGNAELHVWSGGFHGFQSFTHTAVTQGAIESRRNWLGRLLGHGPLPERAP